ncbi:MAG: PKD domain-containing protein [bacterium]|nr:PKD domain-containing protein [bacterium]
MNLPIRSLLIVVIIVLVIAGCSGQRSQPIAPDMAGSQPELSGNAEIQSDSGESSHYLLFYNMIYIDLDNPDGPKFEIIPVRETEIHLNILKFLEDGPCFNCFKIVGFNFPQPGYLDVDIQIDHPFDDLSLSVFDVRGIMMFQGSHTFPVAGKTTSDPALGDGALLNPDGYTALYNGSTITAPVGALQKYYPGNYATPAVPNSIINGYKYYITDNPLNNRNAFFAGTSDIQTFSIKLPTGPFVLGYAVDANWWTPISEPVDDPLTDFGLNANCPEPWKIVITEEPIDDGLTDQGGQTKLLVDVYDWQGKVTHHYPTVECPELFDGSSQATLFSDGSDHAIYEVTISNTKLAPIGEYTCLIGVEANENDPVGKPWLDLTAYQLQTLTVIAKPTVNPVAVAEAIPNPQAVFQPVSFSGTASNDPDGGDIVLYEWDWDNDGVYDETGENTEHTWNDAGNNYVQLRVTDDDDETDTLDEPLEVKIVPVILLWAKSAGGVTRYDESHGITSLSDDSVVVTGGFGETATFGLGEPNQTVLTCDGGNYDYDIFIARYNPNGTLAWAKSAEGGSYWDQGFGITSLSDDSAVVTGMFFYSTTFGLGESNQTILTSNGNDDIFVARFNPDGTLAWAKSAGGASQNFNDMGLGITTLSDNSTVVTGKFGGSATFGEGEPNQTVLTSIGSTDLFIARYNLNGALIWAKQAEGAPGHSQGNGITTLIDNSTVVTGGFSGSATFGSGEPNQTVLTSFSDYTDFFIARYNSDGTLAWAKRAGGIENDCGRGITTLSDDTTVVTGYFNESATFAPGEPNQTVLTSTGYGDIFIACYNPDGTLAWAKSAGGPAGDPWTYDDGCGITTLSDNSTVVTGEFYESATFGLGEPNQTILTSGGGYETFIAHYNSDGSLAWARRDGGGCGNGITTLLDDSIVVTGRFGGSATFGQGESNETILTSAGSYDIFIARYAE